MVRWCLSVKQTSSTAYDTLYNSGLVTLSSKQTLRYYTHTCVVSSGFCNSIDDRLIQDASFDGVADWQEHVVLIFDEMHIKEDLVFNKTTGLLKGFIIVCDIYQQSSDEI